MRPSILVTGLFLGLGIVSAVPVEIPAGIAKRDALPGGELPYNPRLSPQ